MERTDITDELLVAFADGELDEPQNSEVADLVSKHSDLAETVEKQRLLGENLKALFDVSDEKTPDNISQWIDELVEKKSRDSTQTNVVSLSAFRRFREKANISLVSISQMAAALAVGVYFAPSIMQNTTVGLSEMDQNNLVLAQIDQNPLVLRSAVSADGITSPNKTLSLTELKYQVSLIQDTKRIFSNGTIEENNPFRLSIIPPFDGHVNIFEVKPEGVEDLLFKEIKTKRGEELWLPRAQAFELSEQSEFFLKIVFVNDKTSIETNLNFYVK